MTSSTKKQSSSAIIVHKPKRTATSTSTIHKAEQALPAWRGAGRSSRDTNTLLSSSDDARRCRIRLLFSAAGLLKMLNVYIYIYLAIRLLLSLKLLKSNTIKSSTEKQRCDIIHQKTEQLCHHRPQTEAHSYEYEHNTHKAEQALPAWRRAGRSSRDPNPPLSSSDGARRCRIRLPFPLLFCSNCFKIYIYMDCYYAAAVAEIT